MLKEKNRGFLLLCTSHGYYGRMCWNLAATLKASEKIPVAVVSDSIGLSHLSQHQLQLFDYIIPLPDHVGGGFSPKLYLNELTPFEETIFFDADMLWLPDKKPSDLFDELSQVDYTGITEGWCDIETLNCDNANPAYYFWADVAEIKEVYKLKEGKLYQWRSEVIYFKKNAKTDKFFKKAQSIHQKPKLKSIKHFGTHIPDELSINISAAIHGFAPHKEKWTPAYWHKLHKDQIPRPDSMKQWYLVSFGSNYASGTIKKLYDTIAGKALKSLGRQHVFGLHSKASYLPERLKM